MVVTTGYDTYLSQHERNLLYKALAIRFRAVVPNEYAVAVAGVLKNLGAAARSVDLETGRLLPEAVVFEVTDLRRACSQCAALDGKTFPSGEAALKAVPKHDHGPGGCLGGVFRPAPAPLVVGEVTILPTPPLRTCACSQCGWRGTVAETHFRFTIDGRNQERCPECGGAVRHAAEGT